MKLIAAILVVLGVALIADAQCRPVVRAQYQQHHQAAAVVVVPDHHAAIVTPFVAATFVPVPVYQVPVYTHGYTPYDDAENKALRVQNATLKQQNDFVLQLLQLNAPGVLPPDGKLPLQQKQPAPNGQEVPKANANAGHPAVGILKKNCASCHSGAASKGGFALFAGDSFAPLTVPQRFSIFEEVMSSRMPKNGKLTDEEVSNILDWLKTK